MDELEIGHFSTHQQLLPDNQSSRQNYSNAVAKRRVCSIREMTNTQPYDSRQIQHDWCVNEDFMRLLLAIYQSYGSCPLFLLLHVIHVVIKSRL